MNKNAAQQLVMILIVSALSSLAAMPQKSGITLESTVIKEHFDKMYRIDPRLISGDYYQPRMSIANGHPFFIDTIWKEGYVVMDGVLFDNLLLKYDVSSNEVILRTKNIASTYMQLILKKNHIDSFKMGDHSFRPFPGKFQNSSSYFCEVLTQGDIELLHLRSKNIVVASTGLLEYKYLINHAEFLLLNGNLTRYRGRKTLMKLFPDFKSNIRAFINDNNLKYKRLSLEDSARVITYCNSFINEK